MRGSAFIAFFGLATAVSGTLIGCGDDEEAPAAAKITKSGANESCTRTDDCAKGLSCVSNICTDSGGGTGGTDNTGGSSGTGKGGSTSSPLGGEGETCSRRADCQTNFGCFNGRCAVTETGEGGGPSTGGTIGGIGETCQLSADCEEGLLCMPGIAFVGVCTPADTGIEPTGNVCGAECVTAEDCCELPIELHATLTAKSCTEIDDLLTGVNCATTAVALQDALCLARDVYCTCDPQPWECTAAGRCSYVATCTASGAVPGGCPSFTRTGAGLVTTCNADTDNCEPDTVAPPCTAAADCVNQAVSDDPTDTCVAGECVCFQNACYRRCAENIDCPAAFRCDAAPDVCVPEDSCTEDLTCQTLSGDYRATCVAGVCTRPCEVDRDCNPAGLINGGFQQVCNADNQCEALGCSGDIDCPGTSPTVPATNRRLFCTPRNPAMTAQGARSAITD
jgi:hypothetical protein